MNMQTQLVLADGRIVRLGTPWSPLPQGVTAPFVALLPAHNKEERLRAERLAAELHRLGCIELCCVGPESEQLHDALDQVMEDKDACEVVTTWHTDATDACEYFLFAAGGGAAALLALVADHPDLTDLLKQTASL